MTETVLSEARGFELVAAVLLITGILGLTFKAIIDHEAFRWRKGACFHYLSAWYLPSFYWTKWNRQ